MMYGQSERAYETYRQLPKTANTKQRDQDIILNPQQCKLSSNK